MARGTATSLAGNWVTLGRHMGSPTARRWRDLLSHAYQWREIFPYTGNAIKRISGKRKGYLCDTGLACALQRISTPEALPVSPLLGALFESWVVNHVHQQFVQLPVPPQVYHWRTSGGAEVDLILELDGKLYPIEIKCKTNLTGHDTRGLRSFRESQGEKKVQTALIVYAGQEIFQLDAHTIAIPWNLECAAPPSGLVVF